MPKTTELQLPIKRVKTIMRSSPDVVNIGQDALQVVTRATELFVQHLTLKASKKSVDDKIIYKDISEVVQSEDYMTFLREIIPRKITAKDYFERTDVFNGADKIDASTQSRSNSNSKNSQSPEKKINPQESEPDSNSDSD
uniref:Chromatin accessibility complex protein 1 n=1 Tax=Clastoptera arizonana TaxID=38151 RepID=A0A1B6CHG3_9HEMI